MSRRPAQGARTSWRERVHWEMVGALAGIGGLIVALAALRTGGEPGSSTTPAPPTPTVTVTESATPSSRSRSRTPKPTAEETPSAEPAEPACVMAPGECRLEKMLGSADLRNCRPAARPPAGAVAALDCTAVRSGPVHDPMIVLFRSDTDAETWVESYWWALHDGRGGNCATGAEYKGTWVRGKLLCTINGPYYAMSWTYTGRSVAMTAEAWTPQPLYAWWQGLSLLGN
ncbi:hypothetical protein [Nonomuraea angiospora]|uniref:hypothetical protein n=1 Tax=Nonomuraea angiospora TaxID=46172 RepID=UPI0029ADDED1|nr:hypothetical protein [Nonomuraea angiospora]MDX3101653.1 hypothetical protein [Nonomuraea angiospora]